MKENIDSWTLLKQAFALWETLWGEWKEKPQIDSKYLENTNEIEVFYQKKSLKFYEKKTNNTVKNRKNNREWWYTPVMSAHKWLRQENPEFKATQRVPGQGELQRELLLQK
jgi:hypothetical protein